VIIVLVILLAGNAFFVGAQFALITARRDQIEPLAAAGGRAARITLGQMRQLSRMLAGSQLGIAMCSLGLGAVAEPAFEQLLAGGFALVRLPDALVHPVSFVIALAIVSYCHMVLGEMVPKNLALAGPVRAALLLGPPMAVWTRGTRPVLVAINAAANGLLRLFGVQPRDELVASYTPDELSEMIAESAAVGLLGAVEQEKLSRALALHQLTAADLVIGIDELVTVGPRSSPRDLEGIVARTGHSRFPVQVSEDGRGPSLVGYVHAKDILGLPASLYDRPISEELRRTMMTVDADLPLTRTFAALQGDGHHMGRVERDGTTLGVVLLGDVVAELVGEVREARLRYDAMSDAE
jgi:CBS domain containing-hemolysin-like protein